MNKDRYKIFFENSADAMLIIENDEFVDCNFAAVQMLGFASKEELINKHPSKLSPDFQPDGMSSSDKAEEMMQIAKNNGAHKFEWDHLRKNGTILQVEVSLTTIEIESQLQIHTVWRDITERKQATDALRNNEIFLSTIIENIPDMVFVKEAKNLTFVRFNKAGEKITGYSREALLGKNDYDFFPKEEADFFAERDKKVLEKNILLDIPEEVLSTANGEQKILHTKKIAVMNENGTAEYLLGISEDITEKKKFHEAQMRSSQLSALGEVAAGVAHEINNPINGVINYAQMLMNQNDEHDKSNQILERIIKEGSRISNIVKNLLNFSQKDRGEFSFLDLMDIVIEPLNLTSQLLKKDGIHIEVGIPENLPKIFGNQMQLEQVILNILSNARHALNKKFPEPTNEKFIVIDAKSLNGQNGECVMLRVKDFGCGIPKDHLEKVFNPFFTTKEAGVGTGLGMSVSHEILEKHGATIFIDSQVNKFTIVTITFPVKS